jgi:phage terminase small subunit
MKRGVIMAGLSSVQQAFCQEYVNNGSNGTQAYMKAYKTCKKESTAMASASRLLRNVKVKEYIDELQQELKSKAIMTAEERMEWLTKVIKGEIKHTSYDGNGNSYESEAYINDKMKAIDILNKMDGNYTTKVEADVGFNIRVDLDD